MTKWLLLCGLLFSSARADTFTAAPLKGYSLCPIDAESFSITDKTNSLSSAFASDTAKALNNKLTAYRLIKEGKCSNRFKLLGFPEINIILTAPIAGGARGYTVITKVYVFDKGGAVDLWNTVRAGVSSQSAFELEKGIQQTISEQLDELSAEYVLANP